MVMLAVSAIQPSTNFTVLQEQSPLTLNYCNYYEAPSVVLSIEASTDAVAESAKEVFAATEGRIFLVAHPPILLHEYVCSMAKESSEIHSHDCRLLMTTLMTATVLVRLWNSSVESPSLQSRML